MDTSEKRMIGPQRPNLTITKPPDMTPLADVELASLARAEGKEVELNDDGQIVDKRELLSAGLNLSLPNTRHLGKSSASHKHHQGEKDEVVQAHRAVGVAASRREINERRAREIQQQMAEEVERVEQLKKENVERALQRALTKRNNETDVESARARYMERKRQRIEDDQRQASASQ